MVKVAVMVILWVLRVLMVVSRFRAHLKVLVSSRLLGSCVLFVPKFSLYMLNVGVNISLNLELALFGRHRDHNGQVGDSNDNINNST